MRTSFASLVVLALAVVAATVAASSQPYERALNTPPAALAGRGPGKGEATPDQVNKLCDRLVLQLGATKVLKKGLSIDPLRYFDSANHYYSAIQDSSPACVVYPSSPEDVKTAYAGIKDTKAAFAVVSGGHSPNWGWNSTPGVLIDNRNMRKLQVNNDQTVTLQPGLRWGEVYQKLELQGLTVLGGRLSNVGIGLILGGGLNHLDNKYGLGSNTIISARVVLPTGELVLATCDNEHKDLIWGIRAANNQLGIVTEITLKSFPVGEWWGGALTYTADQTDRVHDAVMAYNRDIEKLGPDAPNTAMIPTITWVAAPFAELPIILLVHQGPERPKGVFDKFFNIPHISDTTKKRSYAQAGDGITTQLDFGAYPLVSAYTYDVSFATGSFRPTQTNGKKALEAMRKLARENVGRYTSMSYSPEQVSVLNTRASLAQSDGQGNPYGITEADGNFIWSTIVVNNLPILPTAEKQKLQQNIKASIEGPDAAVDADLPRFVSYAAPYQTPLIYARDFERLKAVKARYDPENLLVRLTNGPSFNSSY